MILCDCDLSSLVQYLDISSYILYIFRTFVTQSPKLTSRSTFCFPSWVSGLTTRGWVCTATSPSPTPRSSSPSIRSSSPSRWGQGAGGSQGDRDDGLSRTGRGWRTPPSSPPSTPAARSGSSTATRETTAWTSTPTRSPGSTSGQSENLILSSIYWIYMWHINLFFLKENRTEKNIFNSGNRYLENSNIICINQNPGARTLDMSGWSGTCTRGRTSWGSRSGRGPSGTSGSPWSAPRPSSPSTSSSPHGKMSHLPAAFPSQDGR